jgi:hypothetical protein
VNGLPLRARSSARAGPKYGRPGRHWMSLTTVRRKVPARRRSGPAASAPPAVAIPIRMDGTARGPSRETRRARCWSARRGAGRWVGHERKGGRHDVREDDQDRRSEAVARGENQVRPQQQVRGVRSGRGRSGGAPGRSPAIANASPQAPSASIGECRAKR